MSRFLAGLVLVTFVVLPGCDDSPDGDAAGEGTKVEADTKANVEADQEAKSDKPGGLSVTLPGVEINVDEDRGVEVKAPGTDVSVNKDGIDITAPNVKIKTTPKDDDE